MSFHSSEKSKYNREKKGKKIIKRSESVKNGNSDHNNVSLELKQGQNQ
jgi:hypothetical protein